MSLNTIDRYVAKKERNLLEYAKILESIITLEDNKLWKSKKEFSLYAGEVIKAYADEYYFDNNKNRDNPILYSNDNINFVLRSIIEYFKEQNKMNLLTDRKNETFLLAVIICTACYVDAATNVVDGNFSDTKNKFKYLLSYLKKTKMLKISDNKYWVNDLFNLVKKNVNVDRKFLDAFTSDVGYNKYYVYNKNQLYYTFEFNYHIDGIDNSEEAIVNKVAKSYDAKFKEMSYELLIIHILEELISNKEMGKILIKASDVLNKKNNLVRLFDNKYLKECVALLVPFEEEGNYLNAIRWFKEINIPIVYEYKFTESVDALKFERNMQIIVNEEFLKNNLDNKTTWEKNNIEFIVNNKED